MNKMYVVSIHNAAGVAQSYGIVATTMAAAIAKAQELAGVDSSVEPDSSQVLYPHVDAIV